MTSEQIPPRAEPAEACLPMPKIEHRRRTAAVTCTSCQVTFMPSALPSALAGSPVGTKEWVCQRCSDRSSAPPEPDGPDIAPD